MSGFETIDDVASLPSLLRGGVVAIGNFDGVHRGHQAVLDRALDEARARRCPALVLTFEPHPRSVFRPDIPLPRITPWPLKALLVERLGFDAIVRQAFTRAFAALTAETFVDEVLLAGLGAAHVVTGFDFHFGRDRDGNPAFLVDAGARKGFAVTQVGVFSDEGREPVSSSRIRPLLAQGDVTSAAGLLGYRYTVQGEVIHGRKLGRTLGYPTANMALPDDAPLRHGIYAVRLRRAAGGLFDGVASFGRRPTVADRGVPLLETFMFDFDGDLYGEVCDVSFFGFLREELKFDGLEPLVAQMRRDEEEARALLAGVGPLSALDGKIAFA